jgi:hypothetical protein
MRDKERNMNSTAISHATRLAQSFNKIGFSFPVFLVYGRMFPLYGTGTVCKTAYLHFQLQNCGRMFPLSQEVRARSFKTHSICGQPRRADPISGSVIGNDQSPVWESCKYVVSGVISGVS